VEWSALLLLIAAALAAGGAVTAATGWAPGLARTVRCAMLAGCHGEDARLEAAYGADVAAHVRAFAPNLLYEPGTLTLPVDYRHCRAHACSDAPAAPGADVWRSRRGRRATVFTRAIDRRPAGGDLFVQYWLYYPDSTFAGPARAAGRALRGTAAGALLDRVAGHHPDDWRRRLSRSRTLATANPRTKNPGRFGPVPGLLFDSVEQFCWRYAESSRELDDRRERWVSDVALDTPDLGPMQSSKVSKTLLR
jgi:hypothetical protein